MSLLSIVLLATPLAGAKECLNVNRTWASPPDIIICKAAKTTKETIIKAIEYWKGYGLKVGTISSNANDIECTSTHPFKRGYILFTGSQGLDTQKYYGNPQPWYHRESKKMTSASIQIQDEYADNVRLVTHELGHALGLLHVDDKTSVMYEWQTYE